MRTVPALLVSLLALAVSATARGQSEARVSMDDALRSARRIAPDLVVARAREAVAHAEVGVAGVYPNPSLAGATSTQAAKLSGTVSIPLIVLGQRGAAIDAARADEATVALDTMVAWNDVRQATQHAFVALWLSEGVAGARRDSATLEAALESTVVQRVEVGSAPQVDALRVHAEKLRADADLLEATAQVLAAGTVLGRWMGVTGGETLRTSGGLAPPEAPPSLSLLVARLDGSVPIRREQSDLRAAQLRADRERALVRPAMALDLGADAFDPTLCPGGVSSCSNPPINYRAQLTLELPLFNQRGAYVDRERANADVARARVQSQRVQLNAELTAAYRAFEAATARERTLSDAVVPAAQSAANATREAYALGRAQLIAVLDAERLLVEARLSALEARAARAVAWSDVEHALGVQ